MAQSPLRKLLGHIHRTVGPHGSVPLADAELLDRFLADRDEAAFAALVRRHGNLVLAACRRVLVNRADVDDAFQATFLVLLRKAPSIRQHQSVGGWLYRVARRAALHVRADTERHQPVEPGLIPESAAPADPDPSWREVCALLHAELDRLPVKFRLPLMLCYLDGKTRDEAARQLGWSVGAVKGNLERGRQRLRERLARRGVTLSAGLLAALATPRALAVPAALVNSTLHTALTTTAALAGDGATASRAALLAHGVLHSMRTTHRLVLAVTLFLVGAAGTGAGLWTRQIIAGRPAATADTVAVAATPAQPEKPQELTMVTITGRALSPDDKPVAGARLYTYHPRSQRVGDLAPALRGTADADGRFRIDVPREDLEPGFGGEPKPVLAVADGYGVNWAVPKKDEELVLRLVNDHPLTGRLLDSQGRPIANAQVHVQRVYASPAETLDAFLAGWKVSWREATAYHLTKRVESLGEAMKAATTDGDGRFRITGVGVERLIDLELKAPLMAQACIFVVAKAGFDPKPYNRAVEDSTPAELRLPAGYPTTQLYGPGFDYVATPGKTITGVVREAGGKPVAGAWVGSGAGRGSAISTTTNAEGRFTLTGLPKLAVYLLGVGPGAGNPLLRRSINVPDTEGFEPVTADVTLVRGVIVTGRVIDPQTGKGVTASVGYTALPENTVFGQQGYDVFRNESFGGATDLDGRFSAVVLPGPGVLFVQAHSGESLDGQYVSPYLTAAFDGEDRKRVTLTDGGRSFATAGSFVSLDNEHIVKRVDLDAKSGPVTLDLYLRRGRTAAVNIQDQDGKPLAGSIVSGMTAKWPIAFALQKAECTVYALDPQQPRTLVFYHPERKLGAQLSVRGDEKEPLTVRLMPAGEVRGRILDEDGQPIAGADIGLQYEITSASELERFLRLQRDPIRTDKDGRFRLDGVVPDVKFSLSLRKGQTNLVGKPRIGVKDVKSGQALDLGDVRTEPPGQ